MISLKSPAEAIKLFSQQFKIARLTQNMTQAVLTQKSGVSLASVRKFERTGEISLTSLMKLALPLNLMDQLIDAISQTTQEPQTMKELLANQQKPKRQRARHRG